MMDPIGKFLGMGGYARFVWPAYGLTFMVLIGMLIFAVTAWRRAERRLAALEGLRQQVRQRRS